jgi:hypothetical protein
MNSTMIKSSIVRGSIVSIFLISLTLKAQETDKSTTAKNSLFLEVNKEKMFTPVVVLESWATYSMGEQKSGTEYANRADVSFRRFRFGASGAPYSWLKYSFQLQLDRLGEDGYASTKGSYGGLGIWNAYITAKLLKNSELLNFELGYFWAAISREFNTCPWAVGSLDKTRANWYMRNFITGTGNGIESGVALGGLKNFDEFGIGYRIGTYEPDLYKSAAYASRLYTGRVMVSFGDPEQSTYKYMLTGNQWRKRKGITLGLGGSTQSNGALTDSTYYDLSSAYGADILINYNGLRVDGEYFLFHRTATKVEEFKGAQWHIRVGYSFILAGKYIEPVVAYDNYEGEGAKTLYKYIGDDNTFDIGVNWYINKDKLKLALHYVVQEGSVSSNTGDYIGLACQLRL